LDVSLCFLGGRKLFFMMFYMSHLFIVLYY
jgi:hypothetical protein